MSRLTQQLSAVSKSLIRISDQLTELAMQLDMGEPAPAAAKKPKKTAKPKK